MENTLEQKMYNLIIYNIAMYVESDPSMDIRDMGNTLTNIHPCYVF